MVNTLIACADPCARVVSAPPHVPFPTCGRRPPRRFDSATSLSKCRRRRDLTSDCPLEPPGLVGLDTCFGPLVRLVVSPLSTGFGGPQVSHVQTIATQRWAALRPPRNDWPDLRLAPCGNRFRDERCDVPLPSARLRAATQGPSRLVLRQASCEARRKLPRPDLPGFCARPRRRRRSAHWQHRAAVRCRRRRRRQGTAAHPAELLFQWHQLRPVRRTPPPTPTHRAASPHAPCAHGRTGAAKTWSMLVSACAVPEVVRALRSSQIKGLRDYVKHLRVTADETPSYQFGDSSAARQLTQFKHAPHTPSLPLPSPHL